MELRHLRYVLAVGDEGSFTRAASVLHVAQQALSHQVADLEREIGVQIFDRLPRGVRPTPAGAAFLAEARIILSESERAISEARRVARANAERIRVGSSLANVPAVNQLISRLHRAHSSVAIELDRSLSREHPSAVQHGRMDIALSFVPPSDEADVVGEVVAAPAFARAILPADHPLARREAVWLRDLAATPMLAPDDEVNPYLSRRVTAALAARGIDFALSDFRLCGVPAPALVAVADAWLLWFEGAESAPGTVCRRIVDPPLSAEVWLLWRRDDASPIVRRFVESCLAWRLAAAGGRTSIDVPFRAPLPNVGD
jgi:DNA-binding transcriptional LysR family regulator